MSLNEPAVALAPLVGLATSCAGHVAAGWLTGGRRAAASLRLGIVAGLCVCAFISSLGLAGLGLDASEFLAIAAFNAFAYLALAYGYCSFVNLNVTSLRIRLLQEILLAKEGLPASEIERRYAAGEIVERRLDRLLAGGHLVLRDGRFHIGKRTLVTIARLNDLVRYAILGTFVAPGERRGHDLEKGHAMNTDSDSGADGATVCQLKPMPDPVDLTLFVACYNEEENIVATLDALLQALAQCACAWEILIIDDASTDRSVEIIRRYIDRHAGLPIFLKVNAVNQGLGRNYETAARLGRGTYYRLICGDNCEPMETFAKLFQCIGRADIVIPYHGEVPGKSWFRRKLSRTYTMVVNLISGYRLHYYNGLAVHLRENVLRCRVNSQGFGFQADILTQLLDEGTSYIEVPVSAHERTKGQSKVLTLKNVLSVSKTLLKIAGRRLLRLFRKPPAVIACSSARTGTLDCEVTSGRLAG